jgi:hypothetical protein
MKVRELSTIDTKDPKVVARYLRAMASGSAAKLSGQADVLNAAADMIERTIEQP